MTNKEFLETLKLLKKVPVTVLRGDVLENGEEESNRETSESTK